MKLMKLPLSISRPVASTGWVKTILRENDGVYPTSFGDTGISIAVAGGAGLAAAGGAAVASSKFSNTPKSGSASISRPNVSPTPPLPPRNNPTDAADTGGDNNNSHNGRAFDPNTGEWIDTSKYVYDPASGRWLDRNLYVYDPATGRYVYRNHMAVDSDMSYNGSGSAMAACPGRLLRDRVPESGVLRWRLALALASVPVER